ncbi:MAG: alkene reductase [Solirubrobacteraceae bacterium]|nr:alkene reductase [Solirubrobacteraceae bacterium]
MAYDALFEPYSRGNLTTEHRIALAPLTRNRAVGTVPGDINAEYYAQRADAAFVISEGTHPAAIGQGYYDVAGLHNDEQQAGWAKVADAVAKAGNGKLVIQLMHAGRVAHPYYTGGATPVAPSAVTPEGGTWTPDGEQAFVEPREIATDELQSVKQEFVDAAKRAVAAGAYGVELHAANGYLLHQFLAENTNKRTDGYGTDVAGRIRFVVEVTNAVVEAIGAERTAIRLSPGHPFNDIAEQDPKATYEALLAELAKHDLLYVHVLDTAPYVDYAPLEQARSIFPGTLVINEGFSEEFDVQGANDLIAAGKADFVAYGRRFLANPDLPERLRTGADLNEPDESTFYSRGPKGYTDYPALDTAASQS